MSVLVKGMEMPENCVRCPMQFGGWRYVAPAEIDERVAPTVDEAWEQGKPDWCPLVEGPTPHGRLIDGDELKARVKQTMRYLSIKYDIDDSPTVIEAEDYRMKGIMFYHGALSDTYEKQANDQGFTFGDSAKFVQQVGFGIVAAHIHGCITDAEYDRILRKFQTKILLKHIQPIEGQENKT